MLLPPGREPRLFPLKRWHVIAATIPRGGRPESEDAWRVAGATTFQGLPGHVIGVFDGVGGMSQAQCAAETASRFLPDAVRRATTIHELLRHLNSEVIPTRGCSTAAVAFLPSTRNAFPKIATVGDSSAFAAGSDGEARSLTPRDRVDRYQLTDHLGRAKMQGHWCNLEDTSTLLLCTDGVDDVLGLQAIQAVLTASERESGRRFAQMFTELEERGPPDDATAILAIPQRVASRRSQRIS